MLIIDADKIVYKPDVVNEDSPILIDFDETDKIEFHTKHGKTVEFVKERHGHWTIVKDGFGIRYWKCSVCNGSGIGDDYYCPNCGAKMDMNNQGNDDDNN